MICSNSPTHGAKPYPKRLIACNGKNRRMRLLTLILIITVWLPGTACAGAASLKNVMIISIDALHPAALGPKTTPMIYKVMTQGTYTLEGRSSKPPKTLISHSAMFTGIGPDKGGLVSNQWQPGEPTINRPTIFDRAKEKGFSTAYFYSKQKLGYLVNRAVDIHKWSPEGAIYQAELVVTQPGRHFVFLHVSGLDQIGPEYGWLSQEYLEELSYIDDYLTPLIQSLVEQKNYLLIITSDHAGHDKIHGSEHPEDSRLPFVIHTDTMALEDIRENRYEVTDLKGMLEKILHQSEDSYVKSPVRILD